MPLYLVPTPIGALADITLHALEVLRTCDYILCEDTRCSRVLLDHYDIKTPARSYHRLNEAAREEELINDLKVDKHIALISDAGTPALADPGERLVARCIQEELVVRALPGPCALITALVQSGLSTQRFQFVGFLPKKTHACRKVLIELLEYSGTTICYETPHRLCEVLEAFEELAPQRQLVVLREISKKFEERKAGSARALLDYWNKAPLKGEIVLLIEGKSEKEQTHEEWQHLSPQEHLEQIVSTYNLSRKEALIMLAHTRGISKKNAYRACMCDKKEDEDEDEE